VCGIFGRGLVWAQNPPVPAPGPIVPEPPSLGVSPGDSALVRVTGVLGTLRAKTADATVAAVARVDQGARTVRLVGEGPGTTTLTLADDRGVTREVPVRVAYPAGSVAADTAVRVTGNPASARFIRAIAAQAAAAAAALRPGASAAVDRNAIVGVRDLPVSDVLTVEVPLRLGGPEYFPVRGWTRVRVENVALPRLRPSRLLVSDYPEKLLSSGVLFTATLDQRAAQRFLYYHYNPPDQPARRIVLRAQNASQQPAIVQCISGEGGPGPNEMDVGHESTLRFLMREAQNEGSLVVIPAKSTATLVDQLLPPQSAAGNIMQLREVAGEPIGLTLTAQNANDRVDETFDSAVRLESETKHAQGLYRVPEFFFDDVYDVALDGDLEIPIGQLPLPDLREGPALEGDYGVLQSVSVTVVNPTGNQVPIALYENPRGGRAAGTYLIDRTLVQSHAVPAFSKWKLREYRVPPHSTFRISIVTMPEGGSSYPVRLILAPDDGSPSPGSPGSPVY
jgi:hypothetical protein